MRVHVPNTLHDLIGIDEFGERLNLEEAFRRIGAEQCGVLLLIRIYQNADGVLNDLM